MPEPGLDQSIHKLKQISRDFSNKSPKEVGEFHLAAVGLLCHLKADQVALLRIRSEQGEGAKWPQEEEIPAITAVLYDASLFKALVRCLETSTGSSKGDNDQEQRLTSTTGPQAGRKRALSVADTDGPAKALKLTHSPMPTLAGRVKPPGDSTMKKPFINVQVAAATILYAAFQYLDHWPAPLMKAYAEDCFGARLWVDDERCRLLVENLALAHSENQSVASDDQLDAATKVANVYRSLSSREEREANTDLPSPVRRGSLASSASSSGVQRSTSIDSVDSTVRRQLNETLHESDSGDENDQLLTGTASAVDKDGNDSSSGDEDNEVMVTTKTGDGATVQSPRTSQKKKRLNNGLSSRIKETPGSQISYPSVQTKLNFDRVRQRYFGANLAYTHELMSMSLSDRLDVRSKQNSGLLQSLPSFTTIAGVRSLIAESLEKWLQSPALAGLARILFSSTVKHLKKADPPLDEDLRVIDCVLSMRLKANQLNAHIENVTAIATRIPSASVAHHIYSKVLREVLATTDAAGPSNSNQLKMFSAVHRSIPSQTSYDAIAATLLKMLVHSEASNTGEATSSAPLDSGKVVKKLRRLLRAVAAELGASFNGCLLIDSLLSFDVSADSWSVRDEENKARLMFQCATLSVGAVVQGQNDTKLSEPTKAKLREQLTAIRKLLLTWCCMDYGPRCNTRVKAKRFAHTGPNDSGGVAGAPDPPDYTSALSASSEEKIPFWLNTMRCLLFMEETPVLIKRFILPNETMASEDPEWDEERRRIELCCLYGSDLGDDMIWVVLKSHALPKGGIEAGMAVQLLEHLFECCSKHRSGSLSVRDPVIIWELYNLAEFSPPQILEKHAAAKEDKNVSNGDSAESFPRLAYTGLWWRVTMLALVMCGSSTDAIGSVAWTEHPTLQALMKMITSNRFRFPTVDCDESGREKMKELEQAARDKESEVAERMYLPPMKEADTKRRNGGPRMSRRLLKQQKEKEAAKELAEKNRRKKLLKAAQKAIMLWDPDGPARKPPREAADLLLSVDDLFGLSKILQISGDPDFVLLTIGETSRGAIERAYDWLIPIISRLPTTISRLPSSASCFLLLRAYGTDGEERAQLKELSAPLLRHVKDSVRGTFGEAECVKAFDLLMSDVASPKADRRRYARRVLKDALEGVGSEESYPGSWMLDILSLEHASLVVSDAVKHMSKAADLERGRVLRTLIVALERHLSYAAANNIAVEYVFSRLLFRFISNRPSILAEAMNSFSDLRSLAIRVIHSEFASYTRPETPKELDEDTAVIISLHSTSISDAGQKVTLPLTLLESTAVVFSIWKEESSEGESDPATTASMDDLVNALTHDESHSTEHDLGLSSATMKAGGSAAMPVESWIMLAKARNDTIAKRAALSAPTWFLPRLLMCSGLPRTSLLTMVDRLGRLGDANGKDDDVYVKLLVPSASSEWDTGRVGHRRDLARRLLGRLAAYMRLNNVELSSGASEVSTTFLDWLVKECKSSEKPKKKQKKSKKTVVASLRNIASASTILTSDFLDMEAAPTPIDADDMDFEFTDLEPSMPAPGKNDPSPVTDVRKFIEDCMKGNLVVELDAWLKTLTEGDSRDQRESQGQAAVHLLQIYQTLEHTQEGLRTLVLKCVPVLTKLGGPEDLWPLVFSEKNRPANFALDLVAKCASCWSPTHCSSCIQWILTKSEMTGLGLELAVDFLVQSSGQSSPALEEFNSDTAFTGTQWLDRDDAIVSGASLAVRSIQKDTPPSELDIDRNAIQLLPGQVLLLLLGKISRKNMGLVVDAVMSEISKATIPPQDESSSTPAVSLLEECLLRLYLIRPSWMSLGSQVLRETLMRTTTAHAGSWSTWPCLRDASIIDMMQALVVAGDFRYAKNLADVARQHPLLMIRKLPTIHSFLEKDATIVTNDDRENRGMVVGNALGGPKEAKMATDGRIVKVHIRHWGYVYTEPLWGAFLDILATVHPSVLYGCALSAGLLEFWALYLQLLSVQLQLLTADKAQRIKGKMADMFAAFQRENMGAWRKWLGSKIGTSEVRHLLMSCDFITPQEAIESLRSK